MSPPTPSIVGSDKWSTDVVGRVNGHFADASQHERPLLNGKDFGMVGDNSTENSAAMNAALAAAAAVDANLFIPRGYYRFTSAITPQEYVAVIGEGFGTTLSWESTGTFCFMNNIRGASFKDLTIQGWANSFTLVHMDLSFSCYFAGVFFRGTHSGITTMKPNQIGLRMSNNCGDNQFHVCRFFDLGLGCQFDWMVGNGFNQCHWSGTYKAITNTVGLTTSVFLNNCTFATGATPDVVNRAPWHINVEGQSGDWVITNCWFEGALNSIIVGSEAGGGPSSFAMQNCHVASDNTNITLNYCRQPFLTNLLLANNPPANPDHIFIDPETCAQGVALNLVTTSGPTEVPLSEFPYGWYVFSRTQVQMPWGITLGNTGNGLKITQSAGSPEGVDTSDAGSMYLNYNGVAPSLYLKQSGTGNTGWRPVVTRSLGTGNTALGASGNIPVDSGDSLVPVNTTTSAKSGITLAAGSYNGHQIVLSNRSAFTLTFATEATSLVVGGTANVLPANKAWGLVWDPNYVSAGVGRWVRLASLT